jgi:hypothetical protein
MPSALHHLHQLAGMIIHGLVWLWILSAAALFVGAVARSRAD